MADGSIQTTMFLLTSFFLINELITKIRKRLTSKEKSKLLKMLFSHCNFCKFQLNINTNNIVHISYDNVAKTGMDITN